MADPLCESSSAPPDLLAAIRGGVLLIRGREGSGGKGEGRKEDEEKGRGGFKGWGLLSLYLTSGYTGLISDHH